MAAYAQILCVKCGAASPLPQQECGKCGGRNARVCGQCGNQNSIAKNYCDKCGQPIGQLGAVAPPPKTALPGLPPVEIPKTAIKRSSGPEAAAASPAFPPARGADAALGPASPADVWPPPPPSAPAQPPPAPKSRTLKLAAMIFVAAAAGAGLWRYLQSRKPENLVPRLGAEYLEALRAGDFPRAYEMFSESARRNCTLAEFRESRPDTPWTWSDLRIARQEPGAILLSYQLTAGGEPRRDHVLFTQEGSRWTRPYNWTLIQQVEDAFSKGDPDRGLLLAQAAATVNPRDPMAWGYLCEAAYYRKLPNEAVTRCLKSLELARTYPSNLSLKSLYHLYAILADTYHHALRRPDLSLDQYAAMLAFPNISPADQCTVLLTRAQAYRELRRRGPALADLDRAAPLCPAEADQDLIGRMRRVLDAETP